MKEIEKKEGRDPQLPSLFKSWNQLYAFVFGELILLIILFYQFTASFSGF
ncbi:hypothetical protein BC781_104297 [Sediminitomix flava]|uniref:Uncharacterized protein n=1 Tax=Sediminitomix flava TaxID=379075 RepID=A0A315ZAC2_SEDFL|nr:hypothetical protein BC781_104297 [Sediminitomix flava]